MQVTAILAEFASKTRLADITPAAVTATKRHILDCTGVALAAVGEPAGRVVLDITTEQGGTPKAGVIGTTHRTGVVSAAWANGALAHLLDYDDTGFSHPTACILPAVLAMAEETGASGADVVAATCIGLEVFERMSFSGRQHEHVLRNTGFHPTSLYGCSAAAAGAGSIAGLNPKQMGVALGLAAANAGGLTQHFGTWGKGIHAGNAARAGVTAVLLARKDYMADSAGLEGPFGFYSAFHGQGNFTFHKVSDGLGTHWSIVDPGLTVKRYPCCGGNLRALDALHALVTEHDIRFEDVERLEVDAHPDLLNIVRFHKPTQGFQGKFSLDYVLAAMLLDRRVDLDSFSDAYCQSPRMRAALDRTHVNVHPEWPHDATARRNTPVTVTLKDGRVFTRKVDKVRGSPGNPMTRDELVEKYTACARRTLTDAQTARSIAVLETLETVGSVTELMAAVTP
jgi:2-methylcitrate dehydratase PrpD